MNPVPNLIGSFTTDILEWGSGVFKIAFRLEPKNVINTFSYFIWPVEMEFYMDGFVFNYNEDYHKGLSVVDVINHFVSHKFQKGDFKVLNWCQ